MKTTKLGLIILAGIIVCLVLTMVTNGYLELPTSIKQFYYGIKYGNANDRELLIQTIDNKFEINKLNYSTEYNLKPTLNVPHLIFASFDTNNKSVPGDYKYKGNVAIYLIKDGRIIYQCSSKIKNISSTDDGNKFYGVGFYVTRVPLTIDNKKHGDIKIKAVVDKVDDILTNYTQSVKLTIYPDIAIDSNAPR